LFTYFLSDLPTQLRRYRVSVYKFYGVISKEVFQD